MNTLVVYHRGGGRSLGYPPNSILSIRWAIENGAEAIEYDVAAAKDGSSWKIIIIEPKLISKSKLDINNLDWADIIKLDTGNRKYGRCKVVTLKEVFSVFDKVQTKHQIHIKGKNKNIIPTLVSELKDFDNARFENIIITSFDLEVLRGVNKIEPKLKVGWLVNPGCELGWEGTEDLTKVVSLAPDKMPPYSSNDLNKITNTVKHYNVNLIILCGPRIKDKKQVDFFKEKGFEVGAWGVGDKLKIAKKMIEFGLDRFTIDNPEKLKIK